MSFPFKNSSDFLPHKFSFMHKSVMCNLRYMYTFILFLSILREENYVLATVLRSQTIQGLMHVCSFMDPLNMTF